MRVPALAVLLAILAGVVALAAPQSAGIMPVDEVRPGMVGVGRTVYAGQNLEEFRVTILGVMRNVIGPRRNLILARLEGGPLANTGVIQGMSGSPVYVDGRLIGAVSYSLGSFPKEPIAGITPIEEMIEDIESRAPRSASAVPALDWPATPAQVFEAIGRIVRRAAAPIGPFGDPVEFIGPASLTELVPQLRPIGAALTLHGFEPAVAAGLEQAFDARAAAPEAPASTASATLRPGDPVGMALVRGDFEMGATGTVTHVDGDRVYAFGHPFLNLGPTQLPMTEAHVVTVLPSLDSSMKLASLGRVIGTITQDRPTVVGGALGDGPRELNVTLTLRSRGAEPQRFEFFVLDDPSLTPLFTYAAVLNALVAWERQTGVLSINVRGTLSLGDAGVIEFDDAYAGDNALALAASSVAAPLGTLLPNPYRRVAAERLELDVEAAEEEVWSTIERAWLDTVRPERGGTYQLHVQLRDYRGDTRTIEVPVRMPTHVDGALTVFVADGPSLQDLERRELRPASPSSFADLLTRVREARRHNRIYIRLIADQPGSVHDGRVLPSLPPSVQAAVGADPSVATTPVSRAVVGEWEVRLDRPVRGSHELTLRLEPAR
jgi:hypothetical protein